MRALGALMVVSFALVAPASATDVHMTVNGRGSVVLSAAKVDAAAGGVQQYTLRNDDGDTSTIDQRGTTVAAVARLANIPPQFVRAMDVARANTSGSVHLSGDEVRDGFAGDPFGHRFAIIYTGGGAFAHFTRPLRDASDVNSHDDFDTSQALAIAVTTTNDDVRAVAASADDDTPAAGAADGFTARVDDGPGGVDFTYHWDFGDGSAATGQTPSHAFGTGHYRVVATVVGDDGSSGVSDPIDIQVGTPAQVTATPTATASPADGAQAPAGNGGPGGGGGSVPTGGGDASPESGTSGPAKSDGKDDTPHRHKPQATGTPSGTPAATPPPAAPVTTPAPGSFAAPEAPDPTPAPTAGSTPTATPEHTPAARAQPGRLVDGLLLADAGSPTDLRRAVASATERAPARQGGGGSSPVLGWLGGGGALVLLLVGGAAAEIRGRLW